MPVSTYLISYNSVTTGKLFLQQTYIVCHPIYSLCAAIYEVLLNIIHHLTLPPLSHNHNHDDGTDIENDDVFANCEWSQTEIIGRSNFSDNHFINTTPSSGKSILHTSDNTTTPLSHPTNTNDINTDNSGVNIKKKSYPAMLKLIKRFSCWRQQL